jgi:hypothetical protein
VVRVKFVHPFIRYDKEIVTKSMGQSLIRLMESVLEDTSKHDVYSRGRRKWTTKLDGCVVLWNKVQIGYYNETGFKTVDGADRKLVESDEIVVVLPAAGG